VPALPSTDGKAVQLCGSVVYGPSMSEGEAMRGDDIKRAQNPGGSSSSSRQMTSVDASID